MFKKKKLVKNIARINNQIKAKEVQVISEKKQNMGVMPLGEALKYSMECNLELIEISKGANPPVCMVMDFGKYLYQQKKKEKGKKEKQKSGKLKGVRISLRISDHDLETKANLVKKMLSKGYRVKIELCLRGREKSLSSFAMEKLKTLFKKIEEETGIKEERKIKRSPRGMEVIISKK